MKTKHILLSSLKATGAFVLATVMSLGFTACTDKDDATAQNPLGDKITGTFYQLYQATGTVDHVIDKTDILSETEVSRDYTRVVEVYQFQDNGTGLWNRYFLDNKSNEPFAELGEGSGHPGSFEYTTRDDGTVTVTLTSPETANLKAYQPLSRQLTLTDGRLTATGIDGQALSMEKDEGSWETLFSQWNLKLRGGADAITYNINDADFTTSNWHDVEAIYINDGSVNITTNNMKDPASYKIVNLPWYNGEGDVASNLPDGFCDNITPENGWALVLNRCGSVSPINDNFLALYHAYSGTLRIFYYVPDNFQAGNDHVWEVTLPDDMAQLSLWGYGLPTTATIKKKELISAAGSGTMADIVTAWSGDKFSNGLLTLRTGWWAFDVDLSLYRTDGIDFDKGKMKLQMYSWDKHDVSLFSTMEADIDGTIKADMKAKGGKKSVSVAKGILTGLQGALSLASGTAKHRYQFFSGRQRFFMQRHCRIPRGQPRRWVRRTVRHCGSRQHHCRYVRRRRNRLARRHHQPRHGRNHHYRGRHSRSSTQHRHSIAHHQPQELQARQGTHLRPGRLEHQEPPHRLCTQQLVVHRRRVKSTGTHPRQLLLLRPQQH